MTSLRITATAFVLLLAWVALPSKVATATGSTASLDTSATSLHLSDGERFVSNKRGRLRRRGPGPGRRGRPSTFEIGIENTATTSGGPFPISQVFVNTTFPPNYTVEIPTPPRGQCTKEGSTLSCNLGNVDAGETLLFDVTATPTEAGTFTVTTSVTAAEFDPDPSDDTVTISVTVEESPPGSITGVKWADDNNDGVFDSSEPGLADWTIFIDLNGNTTADDDEPILTTGASGTYRFDDLAPGTYSVCEQQQSGWQQSFPSTGCHSVTVASGETTEGVNFGNVALGTLRGFKWNDLNANGALDPGEPRLANWIIYLDANDNGQADAGQELAAATDADGIYEFTDLPAGTYVIRETMQLGWRQTFPGNNRHEATITSANRFIAEGLDFGNTPAGEIIGRKWNDENADGEQNNGEENLDGFVFFADLDQNGSLDDGEPSVTSNAEGEYRITDLSPGIYIVREQAQEEWRTTFPPEGIHEIEVGGNQPLIREGFHFGNQRYGHIHGIKYHDLNRDGQQDTETGEFGLSGVMVQLLDSQGAVVQEQLTHNMDLNEDGFIDPSQEMGLFWFEYVIPGTYIVREIVPDGITPTSPNGSDHPVNLTPGLVVQLPFGNAGYVADWGDLPDPRIIPIAPGCAVAAGIFVGTLCYATTRPFGPRHLYLATDPNPLRLGTVIDPEGGGQPTADAYGDDDVVLGTANVDDEDGITTLAFERGTTTTQGSFEITVSGPPGRTALLDAWVDFDDDAFLAPFEQIFIAFPIVIPGGGSVTQTLNFPVPAGFNGGTFARFRLSYVGGLTPYGPVVDGEVEDYALIGLDYGDARQFELDGFLPEFPSGYPVNLAANGARHVVTSQVRLGATADVDPNGGSPTILASGDDTFLEDDEDGIIFADGAVPMALQLEDTAPDPAAGRPWPFTGFYRDTEVELIPLASVQGMLNAWIDWNRDGDWEDEGEYIFANEPINTQEDTLRFRVPADAAFGYTYGRFRFNRLGNVSFTGAGADGEVEDYLLATLPPLDFGNVFGSTVPYAATAAQMGARHQVGNLRLGALLTPDFDASVPVATKADDDDGVTMPSELLRGADEPITVAVTGETGFLNAWIDWNGDGDWDDADEQVVTDEVLAPGTHTLSVSVPLSASSGEVGARFRLSDTGGLAPIDVASFPVTTGEVEDYALTISASAVGLEADGSLPAQFALHGNYPNPFNPETTLRFDLPEAIHVRIQVFNLLGQVVRTLVDEQRTAGRHTVRFNATDLPSGTYLYRMDAGPFSQVRQMVLLK